MMRPSFDEIKTYEEFCTYYWYLEELKSICKKHHIEYVGGKIELNKIIEEYYKGNLIRHKSVHKISNKIVELTLDTKVYESGFTCKSEYRKFFANNLGQKDFHYTADIVSAIKKVRFEHNKEFTIRDLIDVYTGKNQYARYDKSACQWNQFLKDFYKTDLHEDGLTRLELACKLWKQKKNDTDK